MSGDRAEQVAQLANEHGRTVFTAAYRILGNAEDAEDVLQEVFLKMLRTRQNRAERGAVRDWGAYLRVAASRTAVDLLRRKRGRKRGDGEWAHDPARDPERLEDVQVPDGRTPRREAIERERARFLRQALGSLPKREARVFALRYFEEFSYERIGDHLGLSVNLVGVILHRARERLRRILEPLISPDAPRDAVVRADTVLVKESNHVTE